MQTKFNYAWGLIKSEKRQEQQLGVRLLTGKIDCAAGYFWVVVTASNGLFAAV